MKSKISCFNKTIFKKNITQFWPLWLAYFLYMLAAGPINMYQRMNMRYFDEYGYTVGRQLSTLVTDFRQMTSPGVIFLFATAAVMAVFSYLYTAKNANGMHALPVTRWELFFTNFLSIFGILTVIDILVFVISIFVGIGCSVTRFDVLFYGLLMQIGITLFAVSFSILAAMLTGQLLVVPVYCFIGNYLYVGIWYLISQLMERIIYGVIGSWKERTSFFLSPLYYLSKKVIADTVYNRTTHMVEDITISGGSVVLGYALAAMVVLAVAYQFYRKRQLETAGDMVAVRFLKPIFRWGVGICGGIAGGLFISELLFDANNQSDRSVYLILGCSMFLAIIGFFGVEMLMQKNFRVFKKHVILEGMGVLLLILGMTESLKLDLFGIERAIPDKSEIAYAFIELDYPILFEGETVEEVLALHQQILEQKEENFAWIEKGEAYESTNVSYRKTDGTILKRRYLLPLDKTNPYNKEFVSGLIMEKELEPERMKKHLFGENYKTNQFLSGYISLYDEYQNYFEYRYNEEELAVMVNAMMKDLEEGNLGIYQIYNATRDETEEFMNTMVFTFYNEDGILHRENTYYKELEEMITEEAVVTAEIAVDYAFSDNVDMNNIYLSFGKECTNLIQALDELGITNETWRLLTYEEYDAYEKK